MSLSTALASLKMLTLSALRLYKGGHRLNLANGVTVVFFEVSLKAQDGVTAPGAVSKPKLNNLHVPVNGLLDQKHGTASWPDTKPSVALYLPPYSLSLSSCLQLPLQYFGPLQVESAFFQVVMFVWIA